MQFEEMKSLWCSQDEEPLYAMNEAALHASIQRRNLESDRCLSRCFAAEITLGLICGALMLVCAGVLAFGDVTWLASLRWIKAPVSYWHILALLAAAGIWFYFSTYMFVLRKRQQRRGEAFESTLRGELDRASAQTEFQIGLARNIVWWGLIPVWVAGALWVATLFHLRAASGGINLLMAATVVGSLLMVVWGKQQSITNRYEPRRRELESLRAKLADPQQ